MDATYALGALLFELDRQAAVDDPDAGKLAGIRAVLDAFNWEHDDRQYALEAIERIVDGDR